ncbi:MAG TPA: HIT family protein [Clostridiales bacterium]|nr:HIT family protein [Clostridiales bacterium]
MDCIFCKISKNEIPSQTIYEDEHFKAIMDIAPASKGHVILIPKEHCTNLYDLDDEIASQSLVVSKKIAIALRDELACDGLNVIQNNNEIAGQTVFHFHIHLIPRYKDDKVRIGWNTVKYLDGENVKIAERLSGKLM